MLDKLKELPSIIVDKFITPFNLGRNLWNNSLNAWNNTLATQTGLEPSSAFLTSTLPYTLSITGLLSSLTKISLILLSVALSGDYWHALTASLSILWADTIWLVINFLSASDPVHQFFGLTTPLGFTAMQKLSMSLAGYLAADLGISTYFFLHARRADKKHDASIYELAARVGQLNWINERRKKVLTRECTRLKQVQSAIERNRVIDLTTNYVMTASVIATMVFEPIGAVVAALATYVTLWLFITQRRLNHELLTLNHDVSTNLVRIETMMARSESGSTEDNVNTPLLRIVPEQKDLDYEHASLKAYSTRSLYFATRKSWAPPKISSVSRAITFVRKLQQARPLKPPAAHQ